LPERGVGTMHRKLFVISTFCLLVVIGSFVSYSTTRPFSSLVPPDSPVKEIAGYRGWARVNTEPQLMPDRAAVLCAAPSSPSASKNPHTNKYVFVYVNDIGRKPMTEELNPYFPEGSVIVKEKLPDKSSQSPELLTVMIKRGKGFNPTSGDWEYMVVDGTGTTVQARGKLENCQSCHTGKPGTDYVFRTYLPSEVQNKLK
jgi:Cytochrome P460